MNARQRAEEFADNEFRKYVKARDNNRCLICGMIGAVDCAHFIGCAHRGTRWEEMNGNAICRKCHTEDHNGSGLYEKALVKRYGEVVPNYLRRLGNTVTKLTASDIRDIGKRYKAKRILICKERGI